ncbi:alpha/beta hydrolase [Nonomuraea sp. NPDC052129]|uniref:alpha/beta fold hydrolase n=1 Tax=Nonomuraea sp. NPDC052129 TaxID=3154651 RepID=UPI003439E905
MPEKQTHTLDVPGARLHCQVRGQGPALLLIPGSNGDADLFDAVADLLAPRYTVISYDRRGFSRSTLNGSCDNSAWDETHVNDARCLLRAVAEGPAYVFGSSAGAVIDPELIRRLSVNIGFFLDHEVRQAPGYRPDLATLDAQQERIVLGGGRDSRQHFPYRPSLALADRWGKSVTDFPGDHTGYWSQPDGFAATLINVLTSPTP